MLSRQTGHRGGDDTVGATGVPLLRNRCRFYRVTRPILRTLEEGSDTIIYLACDDTVAGSSGTFWCDRGVRPLHKVLPLRR